MYYQTKTLFPTCELQVFFRLLTPYIQTFLVAGSWDHNVRCWQIEQNGQTIPKAQQTAGGPVLDVCWSTDGSKVFTACGDKMARMWDLGSNQYVQIAAHDAPGKNGDGLSWMYVPHVE